MYLVVEVDNVLRDEKTNKVNTAVLNSIMNTKLLNLFNTNRVVLFSTKFLEKDIRDFCAKHNIEKYIDEIYGNLSVEEKVAKLCKYTLLDKYTLVISDNIKFIKMANMLNCPTFLYANDKNVNYLEHNQLQRWVTDSEVIRTALDFRKSREQYNNIDRAKIIVDSIIKGSTNQNKLTENKEKVVDNVNHPSHYCDGRTIEPIQVFYDWGLSFAVGNACKYMSRLDRKLDTKEDIEKAIFYIKFEIGKPLQPYMNKTNHKITPEKIKEDWKLSEYIYKAYKLIYMYVNDLKKEHLFEVINLLQAEKRSLNV